MQRPLGWLCAIRCFSVSRWGLIIGLVNLLGPAAMAQSAPPIAYTFTTFAGYAGSGSADGAGSTAQFNWPSSVAVDTNGNVFVADLLNCLIRKVAPNGVVTTVAGFAGAFGTADGRGSAARFSYARYVALDAAGNLYVTEQNAIRKVTPAGIVSTIAGSPASGPGGDRGWLDGTNSSAQFDHPDGIAVATNGVIYVADRFNHLIRKVSPVGTDWVVTTIAGQAGMSGASDGIGTNAQFYSPEGLALDSGGNIYVADSDNNTIRRITPDGAVTTIAGQPGVADWKDDTNNAALFDGPTGLAIDGAGSLYVGDGYNAVVRKITRVGSDWVVTTPAGQAGSFGAKDATGSAARFAYLKGIAVDGAGNVYVADAENNAIRRVTSAEVVSTLAGAGTTSGGGADGTGNAARFAGPAGLKADALGNLYVADSANHTVRKITSAGVVSTLAGVAGAPGYTNAAGSDARFRWPQDVAVDGLQNVYVADSGNNMIRKITPAGAVSTISGLAVSGTNDGPGDSAQFNFPEGLAADPTGALFVADTYNHSIRKLTFSGSNWIATTIAGMSQSPGTNDGPGSEARFERPTGLTLDNAGNLYVADYNNSTVRKLELVGTEWMVSTIAGKAGEGGTVDGLGSEARFYWPAGISVDSANNIYVADVALSTIRKLSLVATQWSVATIGGEAWAYGSADGSGSAARFYWPWGIATDSAGDVFVAELSNNTIRKGMFTAYAPANPVAYSPPPTNGSLIVTLSPPEANGQWRFSWELNWRTNGETAADLTPGEYPIEFRNTPGWLPYPPSLTAIVNPGETTPVTNEYFVTINATGTNTGSLIVNIVPNPPAGAGWRFLGETGWRAPGSTANDLLPDTYFIEFEPVSGRSKPASQAVQISAEQTRVVSVSYALAQAPPSGVLLPFQVPANEISNLANYPFGFNGQLQTDVGLGSGVAVLTNVVLTAAHLIFNDQTLSYVSHAWWFFREEADQFAPDPQAARGWYLLSSYSTGQTNSYAAQRTNDLQVYAPEVSTPQSRNLDVAALYFPSHVAGGGYGGYLPSDTSPNPWLTGTALKMLVGYPIDGSVFGTNVVPGRMYQTDPQPYQLNPASDPVPNQQVYTAPWFLSYPGNSGGPLYVQFNGYYYPAAVYLGTLYNGVQPYASLVRAIDSDVVNLITNAAFLGDAGTNHGGGPITITTGQPGFGSLPYLTVNLGPREALAAGGGWNTNGGISWVTASNITIAITGAATNVTIYFKPIAGWDAPPTSTAAVAANQLTIVNAKYVPRVIRFSEARLLSNNSIALTLEGSAGRNYSIQFSTNLFQWTDASFFTNVTGKITFTNPLAPGALRGFYRAKEL